METLEQLISTNCKNFEQFFQSPPALVAYAPGRINIIGEHTDYNQGLAMPCAINRWVTVSISPRTDDQVHVVSIDFDGKMIFSLNSIYEPKTLWEQYIYGCITLFMQMHSIPSGFNAMISGNVPIGAGVSSSAALEVAFVNALNEFFKVELNGLEIIKLCQQVEHQYLHVKSGLLDQYASQFSKKDKVLMLDFHSLSHTYINAETTGYVWVLCDSNIKRTLAGSKYSERVQETQAALKNLHEQISDITEFKDIELEHLSLLKDIVQQKRMRHYLSENYRVKAVAEALKNHDFILFGKLLTASHISLREDYEVSCKELDYLVELALDTDYCLGSRMMGGGFGGCTINLVKEEYVKEFCNKIQEGYYRKFNIEGIINIYETVNGAGTYPVHKNVQYHA
ncbi:galactokinase [Cytophaga aurantiaca]|uniref:galactokinase n=1 Tax=Cytophaga aurantiaca TaxID=29530 RepID=UPI00039A6DCF|nr:galactokinase [Cytophaga aurantiaca]